MACDMDAHPSVIPAKAGIHFDVGAGQKIRLGRGFRRDDGVKA